MYVLCWGKTPQPYKKSYIESLPSLSKLMPRGDFLRILELLTAYYRISRPNEQREISENIQLALNLSRVDLGVFWKDGDFFPISSPELDVPLIEDSLSFLAAYPAEKKILLPLGRHCWRSDIRTCLNIVLLCLKVWRGGC